MSIKTNKKKFPSFLSLLIMTIIVTYCVKKLKLNILKYPLSKIGIHDETYLLWNSTVVFLAGIIVFDTINNLKKFELIKQKLLLTLFLLSCSGLVGLSLFTLDYPFIHNTFSFLFFFLYPISILIFGIKTKKHFRISIISKVISVLMIITSTWLVLNIQSIPEITFILLCFYWNTNLRYYQ